MLGLLLHLLFIDQNYKCFGVVNATQTSTEFGNELGTLEPTHSHLSHRTFTFVRHLVSTLVELHHATW